MCQDLLVNFFKNWHCLLGCFQSSGDSIQQRLPPVSATGLPEEEENSEEEEPDPEEVQRSVLGNQLEPEWGRFTDQYQVVWTELD